MAEYISQVHLADDELYRLFSTERATVLSGARLNTVPSRLEATKYFLTRSRSLKHVRISPVEGSLDPVSSI